MQCIFAEFNKNFKTFGTEAYCADEPKSCTTDIYMLATTIYDIIMRFNTTTNITLEILLSSKDEIVQKIGSREFHILELMMLPYSNRIYINDLELIIDYYYSNLKDFENNDFLNDENDPINKFDKYENRINNNYSYMHNIAHTNFLDSAYYYTKFDISMRDNINEIFKSTKKEDIIIKMLTLFLIYQCTEYEKTNKVNFEKKSLKSKKRKNIIMNITINNKNYNAEHLKNSSPQDEKIFFEYIVRSIYYYNNSKYFNNWKCNSAIKFDNLNINKTIKRIGTYLLNKKPKINLHYLTCLECIEREFNNIKSN